MAAISQASLGVTQRFDYLKDTGQNQALLEVMFPPLGDAHTIYNAASAARAGHYKEAAWDAAPFVAGTIAGEVAPYIGKAAKAVLTKENIQKAADAIEDVFRGSKKASGIPEGAIEIKSVGAVVNWA